MNITIEKIIKEINRLEEQKKMQEMKEAKMIEEAVLITNPKQAKIKNLGFKYVIFSEFCEEDKIYMVTDETLAQAIRKYQDNFRNPDTKNNKLEKAKEIIKKIFRYKNCGFSEKKSREALDMAIIAIETVEESEKAQEQEIYNNFKIMSKLQETNDMEKAFKDLKIMLPSDEIILVDIAKSLAIIADEFCEMKKAECIFDVYKNEKNKKREEIIKMLKMLKKAARYNDCNTLIEDVRLSSFNFVIDKAIKFLETESEEK